MFSRQRLLSSNKDTLYTSPWDPQAWGPSLKVVANNSGFWTSVAVKSGAIQNRAISMSTIFTCLPTEIENLEIIIIVELFFFFLKW